MAVTGWPTEAAEGQVATELRWRKMARLWSPDGVVVGVLNQMTPTLDAGQVTVQTGAAWIDGHYAENDTPAVVPAGADGLVVLRYTYAGSVFALAFRAGATSPVQDATTYEIAIAQVTAGVLTDRRTMILPGAATPTAVEYGTRDVGPGTISTSEASEFTLPITIPPGWATFDLSVWGKLDLFVSGTLGGVRVVTFRIRVGSTTGTSIGSSAVHLGQTPPNRPSVSLGGWSPNVAPFSPSTIHITSQIAADTGQASWQDAALFARAERKT